MLYKCNNFCKPVWKICTPLKGPKSVICNINFWIEMTPPPGTFPKIHPFWYPGINFLSSRWCVRQLACVLEDACQVQVAQQTYYQPPSILRNSTCIFSSDSTALPQVFIRPYSMPEISHPSYHSSRSASPVSLTLQPNTNRLVPFWF